MGILARASVTLSTIRDVESTYRFYKLQASTAAAPAKPTVKAIPPSGWSMTEPSYTEGSTNSLYTVDLTIFTDGDFFYSDVSLSSSYEAAKQAYNKATAAQSAATTAANTANSKNAIFYADSAPSGTHKIYDIWFDTDDGNKMYYWNGSAWTEKLFDTAALAEECITADLIAANAVTADKIVAGAVTTAKVAAGAITANEIASNAVTAEKISVTSLSAIAADLGSITAGSLNIGSGKFVVTSAGVLSATGATISGILTAGANSKIGPWNITDTSIWYGNTAYGNASGMYFGTSGISLGNKFKVSNAGALTSISGMIGGFNISDNKLSSNNSYLTLSANSSTATITCYNADPPNNTHRTTISSYGITLEDTQDTGLLDISAHGINAGVGIIEAGLYIEDGSTLAEKYMGMTSANGYWGMTPNGANNVYVRTTAAGLIPYQSGGSGTLGTSTWPFSTIYGTTIYGSTIRPWQIEFNPPAAAGHGGYIDFHYNGSTADYTSRIIESSSGTLSVVGNLSVSKSLTTISTIIASYNGAMIRATNPTHGNLYAGLHAAGDGCHGVYSNGYWNGSALTGSGRWLIYRNTADYTCVGSELYTHNEGYTSLRPVVGTNAGSNAVGVIVSNSASFGIYGRWAGGATAAMSGRTISCPSSDIRLKENIEDSTVDALSVINAIKIRQFDWKDKSRGHWDCGMVVDEMERDIDPKFSIGGEDDEEGNPSYKSVDTFYLQGYEVKAIQELHAEIRALKGQLEELKSKIA